MISWLQVNASMVYDGRFLTWNLIAIWLWGHVSLIWLQYKILLCGYHKEISSSSTSVFLSLLVGGKKCVLTWALPGIQSVSAMCYRPVTPNRLWWDILWLVNICQGQVAVNDPHFGNWKQSFHNNFSLNSFC